MKLIYHRLGMMVLPQMVLTKHKAVIILLTSPLLKPRSDKDRQTDCRAEIKLGMCVESHLDKPLTLRQGFTM